MRRSSTASKLNPSPPASDATVRRASGTCAGDAGSASLISSPIGWFLPRSSRRVHTHAQTAGRMLSASLLDRNELGQPGDIEHFAGGTGGGAEGQLAAGLTGLFERGDDDTEAGGVDERDGGEVHHQVGGVDA